MSYIKPQNNATGIHFFHLVGITTRRTEQ